MSTQRKRKSTVAARKRARTHEREVRIPKVLEQLSPPARVWAVAKALPTATRAEVLRASKKLGVSESTAKAQYQLARYADRTEQFVGELPPRVLHQVEQLATD